jgi:hypothetical protein
MVCVVEGERPLLVAATAIGTPSNPTPRARFRVTRKIENQRSNTYGFWVKEDTIVPEKSSRPPGSGYRYLGFPCRTGLNGCRRIGFTLAPSGRSHEPTAACACIKNAAREFFTLARVGTPVYIAQTQPEDATWGKDAPRPQDCNDPDPPSSILISSQAFKADPNQYLRE